MKFDKKVILAYSDPAGFNIIGALIDEFIANRKKHNIDFKVFTNHEGIINKEYSSFIEIISNSLSEVENEIDKFCPDKVFTATSMNIFEHLWRISSKKRKIRVESYVDHWTGIRKRFFFLNRLVYPDKIFLINEEAKKIAVSEGIPKEIISINNNPYYKKVKMFKPDKSKVEFLNDLKISNKQKILLYISDNIKETPYFNDLGFNELSIFENLMRSLIILDESEKIITKNQIIILIKLHPREKENKYYDLIKKYKYQNVRIIRQYNSLVLNYYSDIVVGTFSNMVIEAYILNKSLLRVQIGIKKEDPLKYNPLKGKFISTPKKLNLELEKIIN